MTKKSMTNLTRFDHFPSFTMLSHPLIALIYILSMLNHPHQAVITLMLIKAHGNHFKEWKRRSFSWQNENKKSFWSKNDKNDKKDQKMTTKVRQEWQVPTTLSSNYFLLPVSIDCFVIYTFHHQLHIPNCLRSEAIQSQDEPFQRTKK